MYSDVFCKVYNEFGWNYYPEAFGQELLQWLRKQDIPVKSALDLACGTGILCELLHSSGIEAAGMDFSPGMIDIARQNNPKIHYDVADMITYCPNRQYDLVTCTGDALNHILDPDNVERIFENVFDYLSPGGYFIFDILNENEVHPGEPFELDFSDTVRAVFQITRENEALIHLNTTVFENGVQQFHEVITETVHDPELIHRMLYRCGFRVLRRDNTLLGAEERRGTTWYFIAQKP